jgi:methionine-rich copper-binding protein CopC
LTRLAALLAASGAVLVLATSAAAHSLLLGSTPAPGAVVTTSPPHVTLRFNNRIETRLSRVRLVDERGRVAAAPVATRASASPQTLEAVVPPLLPGLWRVEWQVFSADGHTVSGSYAFRLAP